MGVSYNLSQERVEGTSPPTYRLWWVPGMTWQEEDKRVGEDCEAPALKGLHEIPAVGEDNQKQAVGRIT